MVDGYGVKGKFTSNTGASAAKKNKEKKYKDASFRADEEKSLTKSIGTAGPKMRADGTPKDDSGPTAKQKEEFREQEETYQTKSPGTVGDKYYKNPEGTGTGQGGSGIPVDKTDTQQTTMQSPLSRPDDISDSFSYDDSPITIINIKEEPKPISGLTETEMAEYQSNLPFGTLLDQGDQLPLLLSAFRKIKNRKIEVKPRFSLDRKGTLIRGVDFKYTF